MKSLKSILARRDPRERKPYITREFQDFGYRLAEQLRDKRHTSLYIKMAKTINRRLLDEALTFVKDASGVKSRGRLFMWKLSELRKAAIKRAGSPEETPPKKSESSTVSRRRSPAA